MSHQVGIYWDVGQSRGSQNPSETVELVYLRDTDDVESGVVTGVDEVGARDVGVLDGRSERGEHGGDDRQGSLSLHIGCGVWYEVMKCGFAQKCPRDVQDRSRCLYCGISLPTRLGRFRDKKEEQEKKLLEKKAKLFLVSNERRERGGWWWLGELTKLPSSEYLGVEE